MNNKIAIITFCLGRVPHWIDYFMRSCYYNRKIDWLFFTDKPVKNHYGSNIKIFNTSLTEISKLISRNINLNVCIKHPYKLCDFRPAFGLIFNDLLKDYDYWGYCDNDLIFGDIYFFLGDILKENYHIIIPHNSFSHGHFCLLRNDSEVNNLFKLSPIYKDIFVSEKLHVFDERFDPTGIKLDNSKIINSQILERIKKYYNYRKHLKIITSLKFWGKYYKKRRILKEDDLIDFNRVIEYSEEKKKIRTYRNTLYECDIMKAIHNKGYWKVKWKDGRLFNEGSKELLYFHFQISKYMNSFSISDKTKQDNSFVLESVLK